MALGIDIGTSSIKLVEIDNEGKSPTLVASGVVPFTGISVSETSDKASLMEIANSIKKLLTQTKVKANQVHISVPESKAFTRAIKFPMLTDAEIAQAIRWEAEQYLPYPIDQAVYQHRIIKRDERSVPPETTVLLVAVSEALAEKYLEIFSFLGLEVSLIETELSSIVRTVQADKTNLVVNLGSTTCDIAVVSNGDIFLTRSIKNAGLTLTRAVAQALGLDPAKAEEYKKAYGFEKSYLEGRVYKAMLPILNLMVDEIKKAIQFYKDDFSGENPTGVLLTGGAANTKAIIPLLTELLGMEVLLVDPFVKLASSEAKETLSAYKALYSVACGLALYEDE
jgi:type IV pilus assembly protein PilM